jgi:hypothetical protein
MTSVPSLAVICICLCLAAGNGMALRAQTKATPISFILDATSYTMEKLHRYRVSYPSNWNVTYDNDSISIIRSPNHQAIITISVTDLSSKTNYTLNRYSEQEINDINSSARDRKFNLEVIESSPYLLSGNTGHKIIYVNGTRSGGNSASEVSGSSSKTIVAWTITDDRIYRISCTTNESQYPMYANIFTDIINSFELLQ